ncbi:MAG TPA: glutathione synthetase [Flavobacteriaceae bacterium]|nr:glutathione synthetase [Flavobacteriaceae bacterium]
MELISLVGNCAAFLTTISFLPQAIKTIKSRDTRQLSLPMYLLFVAGVALWIVYGLHVNSMPIIVGNVITLLLAGSILTVKIKSTFSSKRG